MAGENAYIKGMEQQLSIIVEKVERAKVETTLADVEQKLVEVNEKFNALRDENPETFDMQKTDFEKAFNELSRLVTDNSELNRGDIKAQEALRQQTGAVSRG